MQKFADFKVTAEEQVSKRKQDEQAMLDSHHQTLRQGHLDNLRLSH